MLLLRQRQPYFILLIWKINTVCNWLISNLHPNLPTEWNQSILSIIICYYFPWPKSQINITWRTHPNFQPPMEYYLVVNGSSFPNFVVYLLQKECWPQIRIDTNGTLTLKRDIQRITRGIEYRILSKELINKKMNSS